MKKRALVFLVVFVSCLSAGLSYSDQTAPGSSALTWPAGLPVYDHIVIVVEENKNYEQIIGNPGAPFINEVLKKEGASFSQMYGEEHFSQGNYFWLFSGDNHNMGFTDQIPCKENNPYCLFKTNMGEQLISKGRSFKGYSESMPEIGFTGEKAGHYARKHVPWISFANVPNGTTVATSSNLRFEDFPSDPGQYDTLPAVAWVIPNLINDMHDGPVAESVPAGDQWLQKNLDRYYQWAKTHNSLLIFTFDENDDIRRYVGLTNPLVDPRSCTGEGRDSEYCANVQNRIVTIFAGAHIKPGDYPEGKGITHVNILRTIEAMYGLSKAGAQQPNAAGAGITDDYIVTDVFETIK